MLSLPPIILIFSLTFFYPGKAWAARVAGRSEYVKTPGHSPLTMPFTPADFLPLQASIDDAFSISYNRAKAMPRKIGGLNQGACDQPMNVLRNKLNQVPAFECANEVVYLDPYRKTIKFPPF